MYGGEKKSSNGDSHPETIEAIQAPAAILPSTNRMAGNVNINHAFFLEAPNIRLHPITNNIRAQTHVP